MKVSFALVTFLAGLAVAHPVAESESADVSDFDPAAFDLAPQSCETCLVRDCGIAAIRCITTKKGEARLICLQVNCIVAWARCCL